MAKKATKKSGKARSVAPRKKTAKAAPSPRERAKAAGGATPRLLSGGNPQIAKGYGDAPVQAYISAMPGWKREIGERIDGIINRVVPDVRKAVKWNSPLYGAAGEEREDWFLGVHCCNNYIKVAFFRGAALRPKPPVESKQEHVRYLHIHEGWKDAAGERIDDTQFAEWVRRASRLPGERM